MNEELAIKHIISKANQKKLDQEYAKERLLEHYLEQGSTVYSLLRKVSSKGMTRHYSLFTVSKEGKIQDITYYSSQALGWSMVDSDGRRAIKVQGCGMDMSFHLISTLSAVLFKGEDRADYILKEEKL